VFVMRRGRIDDPAPPWFALRTLWHYTPADPRWSRLMQAVLAIFDAAGRRVSLRRSASPPRRRSVRPATRGSTTKRCAGQTCRARSSSWVEAYLAVGGVAGALANLAEEVFDKKLDADERSLAESLFLRAVKLGDTGRGDAADRAPARAVGRQHGARGEALLMP
jgi:conflict system STAND superfamily ATPase